VVVLEVLRLTRHPYANWTALLRLLCQSLKACTTT
jgi:hypothetical protein